MEGRSSGFSAEQESFAKQVNAHRNFYDALSVPKNASPEDIKKAYRKVNVWMQMALKLHPDKNKAPSAQAAFRLISKAYDTLSNPDKKAHYDRFGEEPDARPQFRGAHFRQEFDPNVIFWIRMCSIFFSMGRQGARMAPFFSIISGRILSDSSNLEDIIKEASSTRANRGSSSTDPLSFT